MAEFSPKTQAVLDAVCNNTEPDCDTQHIIAAALGAAADQVVPPALMLEYYERNESPVLGKALEIRGNLLAILPPNWRPHDPQFVRSAHGRRRLRCPGDHGSPGEAFGYCCRAVAIGSR